jgi:hypothetical protein
MKVVQARTIGEFSGWDWVNNAFGNRDFASTAKLNDQNIDFVFLTFHPDKASMTI